MRVDRSSGPDARSGNCRTSVWGRRAGLQRSSGELVIYVLIPLGAFVVMSAVFIGLMQRNVRRSTRMRGIVTGRHFVPAHASLEVGNRAFENRVMVGDSWVLDIEKAGQRGHAVVSQEEFDRMQVGDAFEREMRAGNAPV